MWTSFFLCGGKTPSYAMASLSKPPRSEQELISPFLPTVVQDVAFQLERLVAGMYIYNRQCHKALKPAAIFPIEVELDTLLPSHNPTKEREREREEM